MNFFTGYTTYQIAAVIVMVDNVRSYKKNYYPYIRVSV